ncbi:hypothetical protein BDZ97DRAFT_1860643 [Flammula alnicola]|nr:hypothetical protein BDZ97DRAFT_1860643 [Flammula alnicola]
MFLSSMYGMFARAGVLLPTREARAQMSNAVNTWSFIDHVISTRKQKKAKVRKEDLEEIFIALSNNGLMITSNFMRLQVGSFISFVFDHGCRPGSIVVARHYEGTDQYMKWGDIEFVVTGWGEGLGLSVHAFIVFKYMKGMRFEDSEVMCTSMKNLDRNAMHTDATLMLEAQGIIAGVFEQDLVALSADRKNLPPTPFKLGYKPGAAEKPIWVSNDGKGPMTLSAMSHMVAKLRRFIGWEGFSLRSLRYGFASEMAEKIPGYHFKYLMGHRIGSHLGKSTYQVPHRALDLTAVRHGTEEDLTITDLRGSVAWERSKAPMVASVSEEQLRTDPILYQLLDVLEVAEFEVRTKFGCTSEDVEDHQLEHPLVVAALDAWSDVLVRYTHVANQTLRASMPNSLHLQNIDRPAPKPVLAHRPRRGISNTARPSTSAATPFPPPLPTRHVSNHPASPVLDNARRGISNTARPSTSAATPFLPPLPTRHVSNHPASHVLDNVMDSGSSAVSRDSVHRHVLTVLQTCNKSNPLIRLIDNEPDNPRHFTLMRFVGMKALDEMQARGECHFCISDTSLDDEDRHKNHQNHFSQHLWVCEPKHMNRGYSWRCPVCTDILRTVEPDMDDDEIHVVLHDLETHADRCHQKLLAHCKQQDKDVAEVVVDQTLDDDDNLDIDVDRDEDTDGRGDKEDNEMDTGAGSSKKPKRRTRAKDNIGPLSLSIKTRVATARSGMTRYFCPICLFQANDEEPDAVNQEKKFHDPRLTMFQAVHKIYEHMMSHWSKGYYGIDYDRNFHCGFGGCDPSHQMKTKEMIEHLHAEHKYILIDCRFDHTHTPDCYILAKEFRYTYDAELVSDLKGEPFPTANLYEYRRKYRIENAATYFRKTLTKFSTAAKSSTANSSAPESSTSQSSLRPPPPSVSLSSSSTIPSAASEISHECQHASMQLRACITAFDPAGQKISPQWIDQLVECEMTIPLCVTAKVTFFPEIGINIKPGPALAMQNFMRRWLEDHPECGL